MVRRINKCTSGFTLLETLVALSVLAISLGITYQVFSTALRGAELANDYAQASMYADSHIAEISKKVHLLIGQTEGVYNQRYRWHLEVQALDAQSPKQIISAGVKRYQVVLNVFWEGTKGPRSIRAMTFRLSSV